MVSVATTKTLDALKGTCSNQGAIDWLNQLISWGNFPPQTTSLTSASDCQTFFQSQYDQIKTQYDQNLQSILSQLSDPTSLIRQTVDFSPLPEGKYDVYFSGFDLVSQPFTKAFPSALIVDLTAPTATLVTLSANDTVSPQLNGSVSDTIASVTVTLTGPDGKTYGPFAARNNGDSTWTLPAGTIQPGLILGAYSVKVAVTDLAGNTTTSDYQLTITASAKKAGLAGTGQNYELLSFASVFGVVGGGLLFLRKRHPRSHYIFGE